MANVLNYKEIKTESSKKYRLQEIELIRKECLSLPTDSSDSSAKNRLVKETNEQQLKLRFGSCEPCIYFESQDGLLLYLFVRMVDVAEKQGYFEQQSGCHICVDLGWGKKEKKASGFIRVGGDVYYRLLHPNDDANIFLKNFENNQNYYINT